MSLATISLENIEFFAYHGFYEEEQKIGNKYSVDIIITADLSQASQNDKLADTINYEHLYKIAAEEMKKPTRLLEHIAKRIIDSIFQHFPKVQKAEISVSKYNPPIGGVCTKAKVCISEDNPALFKID